MNAASIGETIEAWLAISATQIRPGTLALRRFYLLRFYEWLFEHRVFDLHAVTREHIEQYRMHLLAFEYRSRSGMKKLSASSRRERMAAVRHFFAWAVAARLLIADPAASVRIEKRSRWQPANVISEAEMAKLLDVPDRKTPSGLRDRALFELMYSTGLRCGEVSALDLGDVDLTDGTVFVRYGKGAKQRTVPIGASAIDAVKQYVTLARPLLLRHPRIQALFLIANCRGKGARLGEGGIVWIVHRAAAKAGIQQRVTPHTFRHSFATHLLRAGADLRYVQELLGHSRIDATECYTHLDVGDLAAAHTRSHPRGKTRK